MLRSRVSAASSAMSISWHPGCEGDEVGYKLLLEALRAVYSVKYFLEFIELLERRLAHDVEHVIYCVLGRNFEPS